MHPRPEFDVDHPERDQGWDDQARHESPTGRLDRNWTELLQELRVVQTGVQLLTGFLLTLPFQTRFASASTFQQNVYLVTVGCSVAATGFLITPVSLHRLLFRHHARLALVSVAHRLALAGLMLLSFAIIGVVLLIFDFTRGAFAGWLSASITLAGLGILWLGLPLIIRSHTEPLPPPVEPGTPE